MAGGLGTRECGAVLAAFKPRLRRGSLRPSPAARVPATPVGAVRRLSKPRLEGAGVPVVPDQRARTNNSRKESIAWQS